MTLRIYATRTDMVSAARLKGTRTASASGGGCTGWSVQTRLGCSFGRKPC